MNESLGPTDYQLKKDENEAINEQNRTPFYNSTSIRSFQSHKYQKQSVIDKRLHVKLFPVASPILFPEWFWKGSDYCLRKKSMLENFPSCIRNFFEVKKLLKVFLSEL